MLRAAGGALKKQLPPFRLGLGARLGRGDQQFSWITRHDVTVAAIAFFNQRAALCSSVATSRPPTRFATPSSRMNWDER